MIRTIAIRDARPDEDAAACAAIYAPAVAGSAISFEESPPGAAEMAARMRAYQQTHPWLVGERDGGEDERPAQIVGYAYACPYMERAAYRWSASVSVYVAAGERGRGHGRALYAELFERLRRQGLHTACAGITLPNPASIGLHESLGFRQVGVYREIGFKEGAWRDVGWWQLQLAPAPDGAPPEPLSPDP